MPEKLPFFDKGNVSDQRRIMVVKKVDVFGLVFELEVVEGKKILRLGKVTERKQNLYQ